MKYENIKMIGDETTVRYVLENQSKRILYVIGINPSTANEKTPDPTMRRVMAFAENNGFDGFAMLNLYPQRSKHPWELHQERCDELHKNNLEAIKSLFINVQSPTILLAFGNNIGIRSYLKDCLRDIVGIIQPLCPQWKQIGNPTKWGNPRHPLYARYVPLENFDVEAYLK